MGRHSIKFKITLLLTVIVTSLVVLLFVFNNTLSEKFYLADKQKNMLDTYNQIDSIMSELDVGTVTQSQMKDSIEQLTTSAATSVIVVNSDWTIAYANINGVEDMLTRLKMSIFNDMFQASDEQVPYDNGHNKNDNASRPAKPDDSSSSSENGTDQNQGNVDNPDATVDPSNPGDSVNPGTSQDGGSGPVKRPGYITIDMSGNGMDENREIILKTDNYTIQKIYDSRLCDDYYELWGTLSNGDSILLRVAIQGIKDNVNIFNRFISYIGIAILLIGIITAYIFSMYITKPIKQLSHVAERMARLDFDAKYEGHDKSEIGILGNSMNDMSGRLEENISQLKTANLELQRDIDRKIKIDEMRSDFLSNVSHELKTPIALIQGYAEGLKEGVSDDPESMDFYCDVIMDEANKMNNMVKRLLTLNQIEFGNEELVMERFNVIELISSIINANQLRASQNDIKIEFAQSNEEIYVWSDEYKIEEVITNYLTNAINHCDYEKKIMVQVESRGDNVRVSVFNTGKNIPKEDIDNIWVKFYKVDKARTREYGGNGIGLSIVKAIMDSYHKECGVINHEDGVEFWFDLDAKAMV